MRCYIRRHRRSDFVRIILSILSKGSDTWLRTQSLGRIRPVCRGQRRGIRPFSGVLSLKMTNQRLWSTLTRHWSLTQPWRALETRSRLVKKNSTCRKVSINQPLSISDARTTQCLALQPLQNSKLKKIIWEMAAKSNYLISVQCQGYQGNKSRIDSNRPGTEKCKCRSIGLTSNSYRISRLSNNTSNCLQTELEASIISSARPH